MLRDTVEEMSKINRSQYAQGVELPTGAVAPAEDFHMRCHYTLADNCDGIQAACQEAEAAEDEPNDHVMINCWPHR